jgi:hypothetical protein
VPKWLRTLSSLNSKVLATEWPDSAFSLLSSWPRSGPIQQSQFYRVGHGVARFSILTSIVLTAEWPDSAFSLLSCWTRSGLTQHSHFDRGGRGVARPSILTFIVVAAEWPDPAFVALSPPLPVSLSILFRPVPPLLLRTSLLAPPRPSHLECPPARLQKVCYLFSQYKHIRMHGI